MEGHRFPSVEPPLAAGASGGGDASARCHYGSVLLVCVDYVSVECPLGYRLSSPASCYKFVRERVTWSDARRRCAASHGGHLLALETTSEQRFIASHLAHTRSTASHT